MMKLQCVALFVFISLNCCTAHNILLISPLPGKSHSILAEGLLKPLLEAGHEVTYITCFPPKPHPKLRVVDVSEIKSILSMDKIMNLKDIMDNTAESSDFVSIMQMMVDMTNWTTSNKNVQAMLKDPSVKIDVVISEWMFSEVYSGFSAVYKCPLIWFSSVEPHWKILQLVDEALNPAYNADLFSNYSPPLSFIQRVEGLMIQLVGLGMNYWFQTQEESIYNKNFGPYMDKFVPLSTMKYNASLILGNSHVSMGEAIRLPQNYKAIGGYHIDTDVKPLPEDIKTIMDNAKNGVIYFSMGSNFKSKFFPEELKRDLLKTFGELKQTVLWKFEETLPNLPKNVHILTWAPQQSILAHPNCLLFITHGGLLSTTEAIHFGVPVVGIPVSSDQFVNVARAVKKGFALKVDLAYTMADKLKVAVEKMASDPSYSAKVKQLSVVYHDRTASPTTELVHWVEHVVKTKGALHLRSPALMVPWYQKCYLDLLAVIILLITGVIYLIRWTFKSIKNVSYLKKTN